MQGTIIGSPDAGLQRYNMSFPFPLSSIRLIGEVAKQPLVFLMVLHYLIGITLCAIGFLGDSKRGSFLLFTPQVV